MELFDLKGNRKYLTATERKKFEQAALELEDNQVRTFCLMLLYSGCRISEALNLFVKSIDYSAGAATFETLKKRKKGVFRQVPLPPDYLDALNLVFDLRKRQKNPKEKSKKVWEFSRKTASRRVDEVMQAAGLQGIHACPKGLRHAFAIHCLEKQIPLNLVSKWMGHSSLEVTAIYANALGEEERSIASRLWG